MGVVQAKIQTVEDMYRLVRIAVVGSVRFAPPIMAGIAGSARTDWAEITKGRFVCCAINTLGRVKVACKLLAHRPTGAALFWRSSAELSCLKAPGKRRPIIPANRCALRK
jgi:hypothetical protein